MLSEALIKVRRKPTSLVLAVVLSLVNQLLVSVSGWLIALALGIDAPFKYYFVFIPAIVVITLIPISINGVGLRELAYVSFFTIIGISREEGMLMGLLTSLVTIGSGLPGSIAYLMHKNEVDTEQIASYEAGLAASQNIS
jgi:uncharacterized membrane protein YbhN (UPF0104 family)